MFSESGYRNIDKQWMRLLYEGVDYIVYKYEDPSKERPVLLKVLPASRLSSKLLRQMQNEFEILKQIESSYVRKPLDFFETKGDYYLVLEYVEGVSIDSFIKGRKIPLDILLPIFIQLADALDELHRKKILHKDINPRNIIINQETYHIKLIDFGISTFLYSQYYGTGTGPMGLEGTLAYIAPEQTGRINRKVDHRSDIYSLGITLYEWLGGELPFQSTDSIELIHAHIARPIVPLHKIRASIPRALSEIVSKMLSKNPEDRYRTAAGLKEDLKICLQRYIENGHISPFRLGQHDRSGVFILSDKLYGRDSELEFLNTSFESICGGAKSIIMLSGYSGVGKSTLVGELRKPAAAVRGFVIGGRFDPLQQNVPYQGFKMVVHSFYLNLLSEPDERFQSWKRQLSQMKPHEWGVLVEWAQEAALLCEILEIPYTTGSEKKILRPEVYILKLFQLASKMLTPIIMVLDDVQWADTSSLNLCRELTQNTDLSYFMLLCTYRFQEVDTFHPLSQIIQEMRKKHSPFDEIQLQNLKKEEIYQLLEDSFSMREQTYNHLSDSIIQKTQGNPFYVKQFLESLYEKNILFFEDSRKEWRIQWEELSSLEATDNVISLIQKKLHRLQSDCIHILKIATCFGQVFKLEYLQELTSFSHQEVSYFLREAEREGVIYVLKEGQALLEPNEEEKELHYQFVHEKIRSSFYQLLDEGERTQYHKKIAQLFMSLGYDKDVDKIYEACNQYNLSKSLAKSQKEKKEIILLNVKAADLAFHTSAFTPSYMYIKHALETFNELDSKEFEADELNDLYLKAIKISFAAGYFDTLEVMSSDLLKSTTNIKVRVSVYKILIQYYSIQNKPVMALKSGQDILNELGYPIPTQMNKITLYSSLIKNGIRLLIKSLDELKNLPKLTDPMALGALEILNEVSVPSFVINPKYLSYIIFKQLEITLQKGLSPFAPIALSSYGLIQCFIFQDYTKGFKFARLSEDIQAEFGNVSMMPRLNFINGLMIYPWKLSLRDTLLMFKQGIQSGIEVSDAEFASLNALGECIHAVYLGENIDITSGRIREALQLSERLRDKFTTDYLIIYEKYVKYLVDQGSQVVDQWIEGFQLTTQLKSSGNINYNSIALILHLNLVYLFDAPNAYEVCERVIKRQKDFSSSILIAQMHYYCALIEMRHYRQTKNPIKLTHTKRALHLFKNWSQQNEETFLHRYQALLAEFYHLTHKENDSIHHYNLAIHNASKHGFLGDEAQIFEMAARFYEKQSLISLSNYYYQQAYLSYKKWGATSLMRVLENKQPGLMKWSRSQEISDSNLSRTIAEAQISPNFDLISVIKASQTLSGEVVLKALADKVIQILMETSGSDHVALLLKKGKKWFIAGELHLTQAIPTSADIEPFPFDEEGLRADDSRLPISILRYVKSSQTELTLSNALESDGFSHDPYIFTHKVLSIYSIPLINHGELMGIVYMANHLTPSAYSEDRTVLLRLISMQSAFSLENALLYEDLESKVIDRTRELQIQKEAIEKAYDNIQLLNRIAAELAASLDVDAIIKTFIQNVNSLMKAEGCGIGIYDAATDSVYFRNFYEKGDTLPNFRLPMSSTQRLAIWSLIHNKSVHINDYEKEHRKYIDQDLGPIFGEMPMSLIYLPLRFKDELIGVITVQSFEKHTYTEFHFSLLQNIGIYVATAIRNAYAYEKIEKQKVEIENINTNLTSSITYARQIQNSILPSLSLLKNCVQDSFVFFLPRDVISGDFYWFVQQDAVCYIAVADCTGHGVPGALMSMIGNTLLNKIVTELNISSPAEVLSILHKEIRTALQQDTTFNNDGMDIVFCTYYMKENYLLFSGAKNPLVYIEEGVLKTIKGDKYSIGGWEIGNDLQFSEHRVEIQKPITFYMYTDGFQDQFGGPENRKYMSNRFRQLLHEIHFHSIEDQNIILSEHLNKWKGSEEQVDDILVLGMKCIPNEN